MVSAERSEPDVFGGAVTPGWLARSAGAASRRRGLQVVGKQRGEERWKVDGARGAILRRPLVEPAFQLVQLPLNVEDGASHGGRAEALQL